MKITAIELGTRTPHEVADPHRRAAQEQDRRVELAFRAVKKLGTQEAVADRCGLKKLQVSRWVNRVQKVPDKHVYTLRKIVGESHE